MQLTTVSRFVNLFIFVGIVLVALGLALCQVNRLLQELVPTQQHLSDSLNQLRRELEPWQHAIDQHDIDHHVHDFLKEALHYREEMEGVKDRVLELERDIREEMKEIKGTYREEMMKEVRGKLVELEREIRHIAFSPPEQTTHPVAFFPLKDKLMQDRGDSHVHHYFMSSLIGRGMVEGPPEFFVFPQGPSEPRLLCLRGNNTSDGTQNSYALVPKEQVPTKAKMVPGVTLISDTYWDFTNPWHSMFNLLQFLYLRIDSGCSRAHNLLLFHQGEFRTSMGSWIKSLLQACGIPTSTLNINGIASNRSHASLPTLCFEHAVVSRSGMGGMKKPLRNRLFTEARCQARRACHIHHLQNDVIDEDHFTFTRRPVKVTLIVRQGARGFIDEAAWQRVVKENCEATLNCTWSIVHVANLTFCQQVDAMSHTDILVSAHGAQLANIIFMAPGGSVLEMFPSGWLEMAGHGQFIYKHLATWLGLQHEGYWRDPSTPPCPNASDASACFSHYKDQPLGINVTHIGNWLGDVIEKFQASSMHPSRSLQEHDKGDPSNVNKCECNDN